MDLELLKRFLNSKKEEESNMDMEQDAKKKALESLTEKGQPSLTYDYEEKEDEGILEGQFNKGLREQALRKKMLEDIFNK